jgi:hypothetical protein
MWAMKVGEQPRAKDLQQVTAAARCTQHCTASLEPQGGLLHVAQEATDVYKGLLLDHRDLLALNVYVGLCYAKLDYYDVSTEILQVGSRLKACS